MATSAQWAVLENFRANHSYELYESISVDRKIYRNLIPGSYTLFTPSAYTPAWVYDHTIPQWRPNSVYNIGDTFRLNNTEYKAFEQFVSSGGTIPNATDTAHCNINAVLWTSGTQYNYGVLVIRPATSPNTENEVWRSVINNNDKEPGQNITSDIWELQDGILDNIVVYHDSTLSGDGTAGSPLSVPGLYSSNPDNISIKPDIALPNTISAIGVYNNIKITDCQNYAPFNTIDNNIFTTIYYDQQALNRVPRINYPVEGLFARNGQSGTLFVPNNGDRNAGYISKINNIGSQPYETDFQYIESITQNKVQYFDRPGDPDDYPSTAAVSEYVDRMTVNEEDVEQHLDTTTDPGLATDDPLQGKNHQILSYGAVQRDVVPKIWGINGCDDETKQWININNGVGQYYYQKPDLNDTNSFGMLAISKDQIITPPFTDATYLSLQGEHIVLEDLYIRQINGSTHTLLYETGKQSFINYPTAAASNFKDPSMPERFFKTSPGQGFANIRNNGDKAYIGDYDIYNIIFEQPVNPANIDWVNTERCFNEKLLIIRNGSGQAFEWIWPPIFDGRDITLNNIILQDDDYLIIRYINDELFFVSDYYTQTYNHKQENRELYPAPLSQYSEGHILSAGDGRKFWDKEQLNYRYRQEHWRYNIKNYLNNQFGSQYINDAGYQFKWMEWPTTLSYPSHSVPAQGIISDSDAIFYFQNIGFINNNATLQVADGYDFNPDTLTYRIAGNDRWTITCIWQFDPDNTSAHIGTIYFCQKNPNDIRQFSNIDYFIAQGQHSKISGLFYNDSVSKPVLNASLLNSVYPNGNSFFPGYPEDEVNEADYKITQSGLWLNTINISNREPAIGEIYKVNGGGFIIPGIVNTYQYTFTGTKPDGSTTTWTGSTQWAVCTSLPDPYYTWTITWQVAEPIYVKEEYWRDWKRNLNLINLFKEV